MEELIDVLRAISSDLAEMKQLLKSAGLTNRDRAIHMRRDGRIKAKAVGKCFKYPQSEVLRIKAANV